MMLPVKKAQPRELLMADAAAPDGQLDKAANDGAGERLRRLSARCGQSGIVFVSNQRQSRR